MIFKINKKNKKIILIRVLFKILMKKINKRNNCQKIHLDILLVFMHLIHNKLI